MVTAYIHCVSEKRCCGILANSKIANNITRNAQNHHSISKIKKKFWGGDNPLPDPIPSCCMCNGDLQNILGIGSLKGLIRVCTFHPPFPFFVLRRCLPGSDGQTDFARMMWWWWSLVSVDSDVYIESMNQNHTLRHTDGQTEWQRQNNWSVTELSCDSVTCAR